MRMSNHKYIDLHKFFFLLQVHLSANFMRSFLLLHNSIVIEFAALFWMSAILDQQPTTDNNDLFFVCFVFIAVV